MKKTRKFLPNHLAVRRRNTRPNPPNLYLILDLVADRQTQPAEQRTKAELHSLSASAAAKPAHRKCNYRERFESVPPPECAITGVRPCILQVVRTAMSIVRPYNP